MHIIQQVVTEVVDALEAGFLLAMEEKQMLLLSWPSENSDLLKHFSQTLVTRVARVYDFSAGFVSDFSLQPVSVFKK